MRKKDAELQAKNAEIQRKEVEIQQKNAEIQERDAGNSIEIQRKNGEIQRKDVEIQRKNNEIHYLCTSLHDKDAVLETLRSDMSKLTSNTFHKVNKSSRDFYNNLKLTWRHCSKLPCKCLASSVTRLDEKVYAAMVHSTGAYYDVFVYDSNKDQWSTLPALPYARFSLVTVPDSKQLLAIGGMVENDGVIEISNRVFLWHEKKRKWTTPYPNMPTPRCYCSSISHGSTVIVAGGVTSWDPWTMTRAVEVLHIKEHTWLTKSYWSVVEQLPLVVCETIPLIVNDRVYIAQGFDTESRSTCNILTASLPELLKSSNKKTHQVWKKLPDMPYSSDSINHYQGHLITFTGDHKVELLNKDKPMYEIVPLIHIYNPDTTSWDCVGDIPYRYLLGRSVHIRGNKILFIGGLIGTTLSVNKDDDMVTTCSILTISPQ